MKVHFVHGWAFDAAIWQALAARLPEHSATFSDRGYFGELGAPVPQEPSVWITHSLGTMLTLADASVQCSALVAIGGFDRFCASEGVAGVAPRILDRMLARFDSEPHQVLTSFRHQCGYDEPVGQYDRDRLRDDLLALRDMDCRAQAAAFSRPVLSLQGENDAILPEAMRKRTLHGIATAHHMRHPTAGHLLPLEDPDWCAAQISRFLADTCE